MSRAVHLHIINIIEPKYYNVRASHCQLNLFPMSEKREEEEKRRGRVDKKLQLTS